MLKKKNKENFLLGTTSLYQCYVCKWFGTYTSCNCKNKLIYIILHGLIKQGKYIYIYNWLILHGYVKQYKYITM
jgi:hypothetical protein